MKCPQMLHSVQTMCRLENAAGHVLVRVKKSTGQACLFDPKASTGTFINFVRGIQLSYSLFTGVGKSSLLLLFGHLY